MKKYLISAGLLLATFAMAKEHTVVIQGTNNTSLSAQQQVAANAYKYFGS